MSFPWCVQLAPEKPGVPRGQLLKDALWALDETITYSYMDGDAALQQKVCAVAHEWADRTGARLKLQRRNNPNDADVRISFELEGSWSFLGTHCRDIPKSEPTMNYGWLTNDSDDQVIREVVLHEWGHALGFIHEHQNPDGGMKWDRDKVIAELSKPPNSWSVRQIEYNVLDHYDPRELIGTPFDPDSIMLYPFPASWTVDGRSTKNNEDLSEADIRAARKAYRR